MLVKDWMTEGLIVARPDMLVVDAAELMRRKNIRQLPVVDGKKGLIGIVSDRDIRDAMPSKFLPGDAIAAAGQGLYSLTVQGIMTSDPVTITPESTVETAADLLLHLKVGALPVIDPVHGLVGIISEVDVLQYLCSCAGVSGDGIQLVFELMDSPGAVIDLLGSLKGEMIRLTSVLTSYDKAKAGHRLVSIRIQGTGKHTQQSLITFLKDRYPLRYYVHGGKAVAIGA